jgi:hypothetical protein
MIVAPKDYEKAAAGPGWEGGGPARNTIVKEQAKRWSCKSRPSCEQWSTTRATALCARHPMHVEEERAPNHSNRFTADG